MQENICSKVIHQSISEQVKLTADSDTMPFSIPDLFICKSTYHASVPIFVFDSLVFQSPRNCTRKKKEGPWHILKLHIENRINSVEITALQPIHVLTPSHFSRFLKHCIVPHITHKQTSRNNATCAIFLPPPWTCGLPIKDGTELACAITSLHVTWM